MPRATSDTVLRTDPESKSNAEVGATVDFIVSSGMVTLPDLTDQPLADASSVLTSASLQLTPVPVPDESCKAEPGSPVFYQSLAPGDVPQRSEVQLHYCSGK